MSKPKIRAEHSYTIGQVFFVHPADIVADHALNTRHTPHDAESVAEMVSTLREQGQIQPVAARKTRDGKLYLVAGFRRHAAALQIVETDPQFRLKVVILDVNDEEAFQRNLAENLERRELSPIDIATAQRRCAEQYGWDGKRIAQFFRMSQSYVSQLKKLLTLSAKTQAMIHKGQITVSAALELCKLDDEQADAIAEQHATDAPKRGASQRIKDAVEDAAPETAKPKRRKARKSEPEADLTPATDDDETPTPTAPQGNRYRATVQDVERIFNEVWQAASINTPLHDFADSMLGYLNGTSSEQEVIDALEKLGQ